MPLLRHFAGSSRRRFCLQLNATLELSATVEQRPTSHISYLISHISHPTSDIVRRQLFDDIMNKIRRVIGIFLITRGFPKTA
jgi:phage-related protein